MITLACETKELLFESAHVLVSKFTNLSQVAAYIVNDE